MRPQDVWFKWTEWTDFLVCFQVYTVKYQLTCVVPCKHSSHNCSWYSWAACWYLSLCPFFCIYIFMQSSLHLMTFSSFIFSLCSVWNNQAVLLACFVVLICSCNMCQAWVSLLKQGTLYVLEKKNLDLNSFGS